MRVQRIVPSLGRRYRRENTRGLKFVFRAVSYFKAIPIIPVASAGPYPERSQIQSACRIQSCEQHRVPRRKEKPRTMKPKKRSQTRKRGVSERSTRRQEGQHERLTTVGRKLREPANTHTPSDDGSDDDVPMDVWHCQTLSGDDTRRVRVGWSPRRHHHIIDIASTQTAHPREQVSQMKRRQRWA